MTLCYYHIQSLMGIVRLTGSEYYFYARLVKMIVSFNRFIISLKAPNTTKAEFANTVDPDETAHNELSHLDLQC